MTGTCGFLLSAVTRIERRRRFGIVRSVLYSPAFCWK
jgi:hypothetical protein